MLNKKLSKKIKQHKRLINQVKRVQIEIIKNHRKDIFYRYSHGCDYMHQLMDLLAKDENKKLSAVYCKYALFVKSLGRKVYRTWCELFICDTYDDEYFKSINLYKNSEILEAVKIMKSVGILVEIGKNEQTEKEEYLQALYNVSVLLNKRIDVMLDILSQKNAIRVTKMDADKILREAAPYMEKSLYGLLEIIYKEGSLSVQAATKYLIKKGEYIYEDDRTAERYAASYLNMLYEKGFVEKSGNVYLSPHK